MVERGQILERMTLVRGAGGVELEGLYQRGAVDAPSAMPVVLAAPHPRLGGSMDAAVLAEIVWQLARRGHATLRFNWRGVGASPGEISSAVDEAAADLAGAVDQLGAGAPTAVVGYSFGAAAAVAVAVTHPRVERVVLVAPPVDAFAFDFAALAGTGMPVAIFAGELDELAPAERIRAAAAGFAVQVIPRARHSFTAGLAELGRRVVDAVPGPA